MSDSNLTLQSAAPPVANEAIDRSAYGTGYGKEFGFPHLSEWWRLLNRHKVMILAIFLLIMPFVTIEAYRKKPLYRATATIEIRRDGGLSLRPGEPYYYNDYDNTKSEAFIIKSRPVLEKAVLGLNLQREPKFLDVTQRRTIWEAVLALRGDVSAIDQAQAKNAAQNSGQNNTALSESEFDSADKIKPTGDGRLTDQQREKLSSFVGVLGANLEVESFRDMRMLRISFVHTDPKIATNVANGVAGTFIKHSYETKTGNYNKTSSWLEDSTRKLKAKVEESEQALADYSRQRNIFTLEGKENLTANKLAQINDLAMRAETDRLLKQSLYEEVKQGRVAQLPESFADPKTADLRKKLNELAVTASQLSVKFGAKNPKLVEIREQMATIQEQISGNSFMLEEKLKADYERAVREEASLKDALNNAKSEAVQQNQATIQYTILQQDLATAKSLYTDFLNKTSQASIQLAEQYNNVSLVEDAVVPEAPFGPRRNTTIVLGLLLSLALGVGLAWLIENLNTKVRSVDDLARVTKLPMLAVIPKLAEDSHGAISALSRRLKSGDDSTSSTTEGLFNDFSAAEAYRMLRTSVLLSTAGHPPRTILVTSGEPGDGKTTTIVNMAVTLTQLNAKVLLIDCDMRKPRIHRLAGIENSDGLSAYLSNGGEVADFIKQTGIKNLSILPSGRIPPNPSELISSTTMKEMLDGLTAHYDYILIDSPPVATVTDPMILSTLVEGVILVAKSGKTKGELLRRVTYDLLARRAKVLGVVLNDLDVRRDGYGYEYYYYDYKNHYSDEERKNEVVA